LEFYHYVGYLVERGVDLSQIVDKWREEKITKDKFIDGYIIKEIKEKIFAKSTESITDYHYRGKGTSAILLLHNIQTIINQNNTLTKSDKYKLPVFYKFPFHLFKKETWNVEHIDSHTENPLDKPKEQKEWLLFSKDIVDKNDKVTIKTAEYDLLPKIDDFIKESDESKLAYFNELKSVIDNKRVSPFSEEETDNLWNLCLLDENTNKGYHNDVFSGKRRIINSKAQGKIILVKEDFSGFEEKDNDKKGKPVIAFIPPCTEKVFQKTYNPLPSGLLEWERNDAKAYLKNIAITLKKFLYANDLELQTALTKIDSLKKELNNTEE
jgi:hypothetical protein